MRGLPELLATAEGRSLLETRGVLTSADAFAARLDPPARDGLATLAGASGDAAIVYCAHQAMVDYPPSVVSKLRATRDVGERRDVATVFLWLDMDRAGADRLATGSAIRGAGGKLTIRMASRRHDEKETRFVPLDDAQLGESLRKVAAWARQHGAAGERLARVAAVVRGHATLAEANLAVTTFLLRDHLGVVAPSILVSDLWSRGLVTEAIDDMLNAIDDAVTVFNAAIDSLAAADVDPQVRRLPPDYLPLHYSCDRDDRRCTMTRVRRGPDTFAVARCSDGHAYEFHLGSRSLSIDEVAATGRWSADVTLPVYLNDLFSGVVAGRSSALYGMVLNEVLEKVLARRPIPMLVPSDLAAIVAEGADADTLLQRYVEGT